MFEEIYEKYSKYASKRIEEILSYYPELEEIDGSSIQCRVWDSVEECRKYAFSVIDQFVDYDILQKCYGKQWQKEISDLPLEIQKRRKQLEPRIEFVWIQEGWYKIIREENYERTRDDITYYGPYSTNMMIFQAYTAAVEDKKIPMRKRMSVSNFLSLDIDPREIKSNIEQNRDANGEQHLHDTFGIIQHQQFGIVPPKATVRREYSSKPKVFLQNLFINHGNKSKNATVSNNEIEISKKKLPDKIGQLGLIDHLDRMIVMLSSDKSVVIDNKIYICLTQDALQKTADSLMEVRGTQHSCQQIPLGYALDNLFFFEDALCVGIFGLLPGEIELTREDLEPIREVVECFVYMHESALNKLSIAEAFNKMKDKTVFIQGELPSAKSNRLAYSFLKRNDKEGNAYTSIMAYLTYEHAIRNNKKNYPIHSYKISDLRNFIGAVAIEPDEHWWIEFVKDM